MKLTTWIDNNGGTAATGTLIGVTRSNVYAWRNGIALPRPDIMERIVKFTRGKVSYAEMIEEYNASKGKKPVKGKKKGVGRGFNSPPSVMKRMLAANAKKRDAGKKRSKKKAVVDPGF